jgi:molybdopterin/thiamine biosynthesis adenylyltransferase/nitroreductase
MVTFDGDACAVTILDPSRPEDRSTLDALRGDAGVSVLDHHPEQVEQLRLLRPVPDDEIIDEPMRWVHFPWRRALVGVLGPRAYRTLRLDRNRNLITAAEQDRLATLRIGVAGLSVGHVIAHTLAAEGLCGELKLADFDTLELSNLNRVPATLFDLGVNKAAAAARRIAEIDPYLTVVTLEDGLTTDNLDAFLDGLDVVIEECDSLDMKVALREAARARGLPVLMSTSDRGLVDVERFDEDPHRAVMHGLLGDVDAASLAGMSSRDKVPHVLTYLDGGRLSARMAASLVEVDRTISTWPQLAGEVTLGAAAIAEAVRRIGLGEPLRSGRVRIDIGNALDAMTDPAGAQTVSSSGQPSPEPEAAGGVVRSIVAAAMRAPSGGNVQPWAVEWDDDAVRLHLARQFTSTMDVALRGSAVALGAAFFNAKVAAAAQGRLGRAVLGPGVDGHPLTATVALGDGGDTELAAQYDAMLARETNRRLGRPGTLAAETVADLTAAAAAEGALLSFITEPGEIASAAAILAIADRARYLTPRLHEDMISELRWPGDQDPDAGIDVHSLELAPDEYAVLSILRRGEVMAELSAWRGGEALGDLTNDRVRSSCGLAVVRVRGSELTDFARGGAAAESVWIRAERNGLAVQPISPAFLYARTPADFSEVSSPFGDELARLRAEFSVLVGASEDDELVLILRLALAERASVRSRRSADRLRTMA